jgi:flagellar biogenesis protein FliO
MNRTGKGSFWAAFRRIFGILTASLLRLRGSLQGHPARRLRLSETLSLGEKRFLAVVQFQQQEFLLGGTGNSIALLARLDTPGVVPDRREEKS